jgi:zinc D-Ala-D-Ala carboxypeptidase
LNLTEHFSAEEMGVAGCDVIKVENARNLCVVILEPIRRHFGSPIRIHDAYRDPIHNMRVGGKPTSWHLFEDRKAAADFTVQGITHESVFDWIRLQSKLPFDEVILETDHKRHGVCVHIQFDWNGDERRKAYVGMTGDAKEYTPMEVA